MLKKSVSQPFLKPLNRFTTIVHGNVSELTIGVPREVYPEEKRVAMSTENVAKLTKQGFTINVEKDAGTAANITNEEYEKNGAKIVSAEEAF